MNIKENIEEKFEDIEDFEDFDKFVKEMQDCIDTKVQKDFSEYALELGKNPYNYGKLPPNEISVQKTWRGPCGDAVTLYLNIKNGMIHDIKYETDGCTTASIATSQTVKMIENKTVFEAIQLTEDQVLEALGKFPEESHHCATLAVTTLRLALEEFRISEK